VTRQARVKEEEDVLVVSRGESFHGGGGLVELVVVLCLCLLNGHCDMTNRTGLN
jgi:hypothetical protein